LTIVPANKSLSVKGGTWVIDAFADFVVANMLLPKA
jgi:hypothetical protein